MAKAETFRYPSKVLPIRLSPDRTSGLRRPVDIRPDYGAAPRCPLPALRIRD